MRILITGGAGFIGSNAADYFLSKREEVTVLDDLSRKGSELNLKWLQDKYAELNFIKADISKNIEVLEKTIEGQEVVLHLAAQVAVTTSVADPRHDFNVNALGTLNVLEGIRKSESRPFIVYSSTNKVYGEMLYAKIEEENGRYSYEDLNGVDERAPLDFHSPYGCSKGCADQYVMDYSRLYGLKTVVCRQSCIYGTRQFGIEDQGWLSWFSIATMFGKQLTLYGDGKQVRDVLFVGDLIRLYDLMIQNQDIVNGKAYNVGGGPLNTLSLLELMEILEDLLGVEIHPKNDDWRSGDQKVFICNISKAQLDLGWTPEVDPIEGVARMVEWMRNNIDDSFF